MSKLDWYNLTYTVSPETLKTICDTVKKQPSSRLFIKDTEYNNDLSGNLYNWTATMQTYLSIVPPSALNLRIEAASSAPDLIRYELTGPPNAGTLTFVCGDQKVSFPYRYFPHVYFS